MTVPEYSWSAVDEFRNRADDLAALETWWESQEQDPINMYGRRRVGKSWLFRRVAHGKPAVILVAQEEATLARSFAAFADQIEPLLGVRPQIDSISDLFTVLYRLAASEKVLVVVDEFPYLLGTSRPARTRSLTAIQAVLERERDQSQIKLILAGSLVAEMERLQQPKSPLYGRLRAFDVQPLSFPEAATMLAGVDPADDLTRYAVGGGMPRYLSAFGTGDMGRAVIANVLDRRGGLFNEPPALLHNELRSPATYFAILETLVGGARAIGDIAAESSMTSNELTPYLENLKKMRLVERIIPAGASPKERKALWRCSDHFVRFWFRFVWPFQTELEAGADPAAYYKAYVQPELASHAAPVFEAECARWVRRTYAGAVLSVGPWWGNALNAERRAKRRFTEEVDTVGLNRKRVRVALEAKWTRKPLSADVLTDLLTYKLPAMTQAGFDTTDTEIVLASRSGFTSAVTTLAEERDNVRLITAQEILAVGT
jgi:hypothetical protein